MTFRRTFGLAVKLQVIDRVRSGSSKRQIAAEYNIDRRRVQ
jgi:hypothetical protein